ncbi:unnamed protein product [Musa acuminata var. zebrina]
MIYYSYIGWSCRWARICPVTRKVAFGPTTSKMETSMPSLPSVLPVLSNRRITTAASSSTSFQDCHQLRQSRNPLATMAAASRLRRRRCRSEGPCSRSRAAAEEGPTGVISVKGVKISSRSLYLDMQATTPVDPCVLGAMLSLASSTSASSLPPCHSP